MSSSWIQWVMDRDWAKVFPCVLFVVNIFKLSGNLECYRQNYGGVRDISEILQMRNSRFLIIPPWNKILQIVWGGKRERNSSENKQGLFTYYNGSRKTILNTRTKSQLQTGLKKFQAACNPAVRSVLASTSKQVRKISSLQEHQFVS